MLYVRLLQSCSWRKRVLTQPEAHCHASTQTLVIMAIPLVHLVLIHAQHLPTFTHIIHVGLPIPLIILADMIVWQCSDSLNGTSTITPGASGDVAFCRGSHWEDHEMEW